MTGLRGGLMVCGTASDAGKTTVVTGLCRLMAREGIRVAPFKAQNMALNSFVTRSGHEIGRAQAAQAQAAGIEPEVAMNPILLKPTSERASQVVVNGRPWAVMDGATYQAAKAELLDVVLDALADLRARFDVVLLEGAGSPAEINLLDHDLVNLRLARHAGLRAIVVGDIERGGVFASLFGTVALLPADLGPLVGGFVINKLRGDPALLGDGPAELERRCGVPTLGVLPWTGGLGVDAEDSLALDDPSWSRPRQAADIDVAVIRFPRISNVTDLDALAIEEGVGVRLVEHPAALGHPDLIVLPGSKATVADLAWLRATGLADAVRNLSGDRSVTIVGICGGYQMLGTTISDPIESGSPGPVDGLDLIAAVTTFAADKVTRQRRGCALGTPVTGYQIHHGRTVASGPWVHLDDGPETGPEGGSADGLRIAGTSLHGLWEADDFRARYLTAVARRAGREWTPSGRSFAAARDGRFDRLADLLTTHLDLTAVRSLVAAGASP